MNKNDNDNEEYNNKCSHQKTPRFEHQTIHKAVIHFLTIEKNNNQYQNRIIIIIVHHNIIHHQMVVIKIFIIKVNKKIHGWEVKKVEVFMDKNMINIKKKNLSKDPPILPHKM